MLGGDCGKAPARVLLVVSVPEPSGPPCPLPPSWGAVVNQMHVPVHEFGDIPLSVETIFS